MVPSEQVTSSDGEFLEWMTSLVEGQVSFGDTKAGLLLTADSILLAALVAAPWCSAC